MPGLSDAVRVIEPGKTYVGKRVTSRHIGHLRRQVIGRRPRRRRSAPAEDERPNRSA